MEYDYGTLMEWLTGKYEDLGPKTTYKQTNKQTEYLTNCLQITESFLRN